MVNWHAFQCLGRSFLFDVPSNSLFQIEEPVYRYLQGGEVSAAEAAQIEPELAELRSQGYLSEEAEIPPELTREPILKALCLHISHDCNLRCRYCFAGTGPFGGNREQMSFEVGRKAIDLLLRESGNRKQLEVDFFGGEPLLNLDVVRQLVAHGHEVGAGGGKVINFTLTTNGLELDEAARNFLNEAGIAMVLSLDGREAVNDRMRGSGVYQQILPNYRALLAGRDFQNYYLRGTYTALNLDFTEDVKHLYELGFREISLEPVVTTEGEYRLTIAHLKAIETEYERLAAFCLEKQQAGEGFTFFHFAIDLEGGPCLPKRLTGCGAGFDYFAVTPRGELYPCHQFVGRAGFVMGNVEQGILQKEMRQEFGAATLYKKKGCAECWARFHCSGGCHANTQLLNGSIYQPDEIGCRLQCKRLECALALKGLGIALDGDRSQESGTRSQ
jgi:uncharacterized protein